MDSTALIVFATVSTTGALVTGAVSMAVVISRHLNAQRDREFARQVYRDQGHTDALNGYAAIVTQRPAPLPGRTRPRTPPGPPGRPQLGGPSDLRQLEH